jgi:hypothetical protein
LVLTQLAAYRFTRPARAIVLVEITGEEAWQRSMMRALQGLAATWGGVSCLPVPWSEELTDLPLFWRLARALDPDAVLLARRRGPDGRDPGPVLESIARRLPVLQRNGKARPHHLQPVEGAGFPFTPVSAVDQLPAPVAGLRYDNDLDLGLLLAMERGDLHDDTVAMLARRGVVAESRTVADRREALAYIFDPPSPQSAPSAWALSETGLRWFTPGIPDEETVHVVTGDSPWDFALAYALRRLGTWSWWLPSSVATDSSALYQLVWRAEQSGPDRGLVTSVSEPHEAQRVAAGLGALDTTPDLQWSVANPEDLLSEPGNRLLTDAGGLTSFPLSNGRTGHLPPLLPNVTEQLGSRGISWISELSANNWQPVPDARLASALVAAPAYGSTHARPTREGVAYLCPHFIRSGREDLVSATVRPEIAALNLEAQLEIIVAQQDWRIAPSDKGQYARASAELFGGDAELLNVVVDQRWMSFLQALREATGPDGAPAGWSLRDGRVHFALDELERLRAAAALNAAIPELVERGVLLRGLVFRCPLCALKAWYGADELAERLRCARCRRPFTLTEPGWQPPIEPQWRYRLAEVLWQLFEHNGDLPLRAVRDALGVEDFKGTSSMLHEIDLWAPNAERPIELDICVQRGPELWIGEAKLAPRLGTAAAAQAKLAGLRQAAEVLRPHGIVLVTGAQEWTAETEEKAQVVLGDLPTELLFHGCPAP